MPAGPDISGPAATNHGALGPSCQSCSDACAVGPDATATVTVEHISSTGSCSPSAGAPRPQCSGWRIKQMDPWGTYEVPNQVRIQLFELRGMAIQRVM